MEAETPPAPEIRDISRIRGKMLFSPDFPPKFRGNLHFVVRGKCRELDARENTINVTISY